MTHDTLWFVGDLHLGRNLLTHTTRSSRQLLQDKIFNAAMQITRIKEFSNVGCLGDVFDKFSNEEKVISQGMTFMDHMDWCMAGNHDIRNDKGTLGSLELIKEYGPPECVIAIAEYNKPFFETLDYGGVTVYAVPYQHSQELFDKVLRVVAKQAAPNPNVTILALHCDYDMRFEATDMMQVLTKEAAVEALKSVDHIILGHEHVSATHLDGRLVIAGNIFPTSFSDISNKYVWKFDRGAWSRVQVWNENTAYFSTDANEITASTVLTETCNFVDISGEVKQNQVLPLARIISSWWDKYGDNLCAVRMGFTIEGTKVDKVDYGSDIVSLPDRVRDSLKSNPNMLSLWDEVYSDILKERSDE